MSDDEEIPRFQLWLHRPSGSLWVVDPVTLRASGPVAESAARPAIRRANDWEDDGCSRGPMIEGFFHLVPRPVALPFPLQEWFPYEVDWLVES